MKLFALGLCVLLSSCATRHAPDITAYFTDCPNKKALQADIQLALTKTTEWQERRQLKIQYYDFYKQCK